MYRSLTNTQIITNKNNKTAAPQAITAIAQFGRTAGFSVDVAGIVTGSVDCGSGVVNGSTAEKFKN